MKNMRAISLVVLAAMCIFATRSAFADPRVPGHDSAPWGPSWVGGGPPGGFPRPAKFDAPETRSVVGDDESRLGVSVRMWADFDVVKGHQYQLVYQLRLQTKKGEEGPLLGTTQEPNGTTFLLASGTADDKWNGLEGTADITRKDLSSMTNLPKDKEVTIRIEPQVFDVTTSKYLTVPKTDAIIVVISTLDSGRVYGVWSLASWIGQLGQYDTKRVVANFAVMDAFDAEGNHVADALGKVLSNKGLAVETQVQLLHTVQKSWVHQKNPALWDAISTLAASGNADVQEIAKGLLKQ